MIFKLYIMLIKFQFYIYIYIYKGCRENEWERL